jgi:hypothetical protein
VDPPGPKNVEGASSLHLGLDMKTAGDVERALNDIRLAVLGILVTIGLSVGFGVPGPWWCQILAGVGAVAVSVRRSGGSSTP